MAAKMSIMNPAKKIRDGLAITTASLTTVPGSVYTLPGLSNAGKTPLLRWISGHDDSNEGEIFFAENSVFGSLIGLSVASGQRNPGLVFNNFLLCKSLYDFTNMTSAREFQAYFIKQPGSYTINIAKKEVNKLNLRKIAVSIIKMVQKNWQFWMKKFSTFIVMPVVT